MIKNKKGFSLIEVMVAMAILSMAFVALSAAFPFGLSVTKAAEGSMTAFYLAQEELEQLNASGYGNIATGTIETKHRLSNDPSSYLYAYQRETSVTYIDGNLSSSVSDLGMKKISVTVYYAGSSKTERTYNITTIISQK